MHQKEWIFSFIFFFLLFGGQFSLMAQCTEYYSSVPLRESPYPRHRGIIPLTEQEAMSRKHYRLEYDEKNRLVSISFWHKNTRVDPNHTANYFMQTSIQRTAYEGNQEIITYYNRFGHPVTLAGGVFRDVYTLDDRGKRVHLHFENENGEKVENRWGISDYSWAVQQDGSVVEERFGLDGRARDIRTGFPFGRIRLYYEPNGLVALMQNIDAEGNLVNNETGVAQDRIEFDEAGRWYGWTVLDAEGNLKEGNGPGVAKGINIPDEYGYETYLRHEDRHGKAIKGHYGFYVGRRAYDQFGNYDYTWFEDPDGNPIINENHGYAYADYTWDEEGLNLLSIAFFDEKKEPVLRRGGYHKMVSAYDENGLNTKITFFGLNGERVNRSDNGAHYYLFEYDEKMNRSGVKRFDKNGKEL